MNWTWSSILYLVDEYKNLNQNINSKCICLIVEHIRFVSKILLKWNIKYSLNTFYQVEWRINNLFICKNSIIGDNFKVGNIWHINFSRNKIASQVFVQMWAGDELAKKGNACHPNLSHEQKNTQEDIIHDCF